MNIYKKEGQVAERPHLNLPAETFEEELGLDGFFGPVSHLYHYNEPTSWEDISKSPFQWPSKEDSGEDYLKPQCYQSVSESKGGDFYSSGKPFFWNEDICLWVHNLHQSSAIYFRNADASELYFCHAGKLKLESSFGSLTVSKGDYVVVPKGVTYRWQVESESYLLRIESFQDSYRKPDTGIMGQQALFHEEAIRSPDFQARTKTEENSEVRIQKDGRLSSVTYAYDLRDLSGWCGTLYPYRLNVKDIAPAMSPVAHLPPSINSTFVTSNFIVCTFLPRPLEEPEGALKVPFFHSNIDYDEVIFYHDGEFFSRDHMDAGSMTLHPRGINHGPQPKALSGQQTMKRTNETAVMVDTRKSLFVTKWARELEISDYWKSWKK